MIVELVNIGNNYITKINVKLIILFYFKCANVQNVIFH
jgi:hypothetical protein